MIMKGQKRKRRTEGVEDSGTWESQREFVFSVSLSKYQHGQELPEPSLRRSVLIANTLKQINFDASRASAFRNEMLQPPCSSLSPLQLMEQESVLTEEDEDWGSMSTDSDFSLSPAISSILTALESTIDGSPRAAQRTPLRSLENLSGSSHGGVEGVKQGVRGYGNSWEQHEEFRSCESNMEVMRSSYLSDCTMEELFQDIDTSLLEKDIGVLELRGSGDGYPAGDDLCYLPPFSSFSPLSPSSSHSLPQSSPFSGQGHVKEGLVLDPLMEVLVES